MDQLILPLGDSLPDLHLERERLRLAASIRAPATLLNYACDWKAFHAWCTGQNRSSLPASQDTVGLYLTHRIISGHKIVSAQRHASSIAYYHAVDGLASPCGPQIRILLRGAQRLRTERPNQRMPLTVDELRRIWDNLGADRLRDMRDRAVLVFGFATALRRSNLVALDIEDLEFTKRGIVVRVRKEKQDQAGVGRDIGVPPGQGDMCPVLAIKTWLGARGSAPGALFTRIAGDRAEGRLHSGFVYRLVKREVAAIGLDPRKFGAHSLRAAFCTTAAEAGATEFQIAKQTGHRSLATLRLYFRSKDPFTGNACAFLGL